MIFANPGRRCYILLDVWERIGVGKGRVARVQPGKVRDAEGCIGWDVCGKRRCKGVEVEVDGIWTIEYRCDRRDIYATRWGAERAARRMRKQTRAAML